MLSIKPYTMVLRGILKDPFGRFLLLKRSSRSNSWPGRWEFPGGKMDAGEDVGAALMREWREETGLSIRPENLVTAFEWEREKDKIIYLVFCVSADTQNVVISCEHDDFGWFHPDEMKAIDVSPSLLALVRTLS